MIKSNGKECAPYHRLTLKQVRQDRLDGLLTAKGAIFYTVIASQKAGTPMKVNPQKLAAQLSISRASFYNAISRLKVEGRLDFEADGDLILRIPVDQNTGQPEYILSEELSRIPDSQSRILDSQSTILDSQSTIPDSQSTILDSQSTILDSQSTILDSQSTILDSQSTILENEPLKLLPGNGSSASSSKTSKTSKTYIEERESAGDPEENDGEFKKWLLNKANLLPQKPALLEQWTDKEMLKESNKREFNQHQEKQTSPTAIPIPEILPLEQISQNDYWAAVNARSGVTSDG